MKARPQTQATAGCKDARRRIATAKGAGVLDASTILRQAAAIIEDRACTRDRKGIRSLARAAAVFNALRDAALTEEDVAVLLVVVKLARASHGRDVDNFRDAAGYCGMAAEASER